MEFINTEIHDRDKRVLSTNARGGYFKITVKGHLDESWSDWLEGLEIKIMGNGDMILFGHIEDQAALMGVLNKLYRLNLELLSVNKVNQGKNIIKGAK